MFDITTDTASCYDISIKTIAPITKMSPLPVHVQSTLFALRFGISFITEGINKRYIYSWILSRCGLYRPKKYPRISPKTNVDTHLHRSAHNVHCWSVKHGACETNIFPKSHELLFQSPKILLFLLADWTNACSLYCTELNTKQRFLPVEISGKNNSSTIFPPWESLQHGESILGRQATASFLLSLGFQISSTERHYENISQPGHGSRTKPN